MNDSPEILVALQLLTQAIANLPAQIVAANARANTTPLDAMAKESGLSTVAAFDRPSPVIVVGPKPLHVIVDNQPEQIAGKDKEEQDPLRSRFGLFGALLSKFAAVIGPMAILGAVVGNVASGFGVMAKSVQVFATTLTPIILPVALMIATAFNAVADVFIKGLPGFQGFMSLIVGLAIPAIVLLVDALEWLAKQAKWIGDNVPGKGDVESAQDEIAKFLIGIGNGIGLLSDDEAKTMSGFITEDSRRRNAEGARAGGTEAEVMKALDEVMRSFTLSIGPKANISGLEGLGKSVQLAALNQDPLDAKMLRVQQEIARMMRAAINSRSGDGAGVFGSAVPGASPAAEAETGFFGRVGLRAAPPETF